VLDAMGDVIAQHLLLDPAQRGADRGNLRDDAETMSRTSITLVLIVTP
jgi:hypothetical protein